MGPSLSPADATDTHQTMPAARKKPSLDFSMTGFTYTAMMLFMGIAAINSQANLLFGVFGLMIGVLLVSGMISRMVLRGLEIRRILPDPIIVGQSTTFQYEFRNRKRFWPSLSVTVGELDAAEAFAKQPQAYLLHVAGKTHAVVPMEVIPTRRGLHLLDRYQLSTSFPFGFIRRAIGRQQKDSVLVYPPLAQVDPKLLALCLSAESSGSRMRPRRGGTDEFYGVKEFRQGENPRWIYWRRTARTGVLVAKEMTQIAPPRLLLVIDTFLTSRTPQEHAHVERAIAMAGSLIMRTEEQGIAVGLHAWTGDWVMMPPSRGKRHVRDLMATLARLPLNTVADCSNLIEKTRRHLRPGTTAILFTPRDLEPTLADQVRANWVVVSAVSPQARRWFRFPKDLDFYHAMPFDQSPLEDLKT